MTPALIIIVIIVSAGILGGVTNFFLLYGSDIETSRSRIDIFKSILMGLCASFTVPLFLQVLPNSLLDLSGDMQTKNYFIFAGLCVLAAFYSKRFLEDLYSRVTRAEKKADEAKKAVETVELQNQEIDNIDEIVNNIADEYKPDYKNEDIKVVTNAVLNTTYSYRTIHGISEDTKFNEDKVKEILELLKKAGYIESKKNNKGNDIWKSIYHQ